MNSQFNSKILLFGEYSIIKKSKALAMPYPLFAGRLSFSHDQDFRTSNKEMRSFLNYLKSLCTEDRELLELDLASFEFDLAQGLHFESTIPQGHGVGSSGALCASVFARYVTGIDKEHFDSQSLSSLRDKLALMECHFHASSSGLDPLISYISKPIVIEKGGEISLVELPQWSSTSTLFILDTGRSRRTEPLVNLFLEKLKNEQFNTLCEDSLYGITNQCVDHFLNAEVESLWKSFELLSRFQYEHFSPMIPKLYQPLWEQGLNSKEFFLKLCGAGGGGFLLGITKDFKSLKSLMGSEITRQVFPLTLSTY